MSLDSRPLDADQIVDRRRLRRKLTFWRVLTVLVVLAAIGAVFAMSRQGSLTGASSGSDRACDDFRTDQGQSDAGRGDRTARKFAAPRRSSSISTAPAAPRPAPNSFMTRCMRLKAKKPMVVVVDGLCASGGYIAALASDHIIAQSASLVGSIGVLIQYPNFTDLLKTVGVKVEDVKSSPLKASPNGFEPTSPEARAALASIVMDSYDWFKELVAKRRNLEGEALATVSDGRVFTGRQAIKLQADRSARRRADGAGLAREGEGDRCQYPGPQFQSEPAFLGVLVPAPDGGFDAQCGRPRWFRTEPGAVGRLCGG